MYRIIGPWIMSELHGVGRWRLLRESLGSPPYLYLLRVRLIPSFLTYTYNGFNNEPILCPLILPLQGV
jgi:hypothetical protein